MFLTKFAIERPIVVRMAFFLIVVFGVYAYRAMPKFLDPDITIGEGVIFTVSPGFSAEEMEKLVTQKIEDELEGISDIRRFESRSFESTSNIHVFFNTDLSEYDIDQAMQEVRNAVDGVDELPEDAKTPAGSGDRYRYFSRVHGGPGRAFAHDATPGYCRGHFRHP